MSAECKLCGRDLDADFNCGACTFMDERNAAVKILKKVLAAWSSHQKTKFKSDGSHFVADTKMSALMAEAEAFVECPASVGVSGKTMGEE
jgi:hypothetical protein